MSIFDGLIKVIILFFCIIVFATWGITKLLTKNEIQSKTLIKPKIKLITDGYKVDTIYIYAAK